MILNYSNNGKSWNSIRQLAKDPLNRFPPNLAYLDNIIIGLGDMAKKMIICFPISNDINFPDTVSLKHFV